MQRAVETKALQPVVRIRMRQTVFADEGIDDEHAATAGSSAGATLARQELLQAIFAMASGAAGATGLAGAAALAAAAGAPSAPRSSSAEGAKAAGAGGAGQQPVTTVATRVQLDTDIRALLEYSTDGQVRRGTWWRRLQQHACLVASMLCVPLTAFLLLRAAPRRRALPTGCGARRGTPTPWTSPTPR